MADAYDLEVIDGQGGVHDLAWLQANYGALIAVHRVPAPCYRLKRVIIKETGVVELDVWVHDKGGLPVMGQPVTYSFPAAGATDPLVLSSPELKPIPAAFISRWAETGVLNKNSTGGDGHVAFQIGSESWISSATGGGPYAVWVLSTRIPSDCIDRVGWKVLTNHCGPTTFLFEEVAADEVEPPVDPGVYATLAESVKGEAERNDMLAVNPNAALCKVGAAAGLWPTSNEYAWTFGGVSYTGQRFRDPKSDKVSALYCVTGQWGKVQRLDW